MTDQIIHRRWTHPEAAYSEQVHGWMKDIHTACDFFERFVNEYNSPHPDTTLLEALGGAAVIAYGRCFIGGIREKLDPELLFAGKTSEEASLHDRILAVRSLHVAHAVNKQEAHTLMVKLAQEPGGSLRVVGMSSRSSSRFPLSPDECTAAAALCKSWMKALTVEHVREQQRLLPFFLGMSAAELLALPEDEIQPSLNVNAHRAQRKKSRHS